MVVGACGPEKRWLIKSLLSPETTKAAEFKIAIANLNWG